ncbi:YgfZ/GcvT domain-containing protein [Alkanindiges illinoisensis]|uniref:Folate-binding Fe/S cluster repair protein n=1 Tax=Alkanindiges illinoisensis TaxID=197183 RepID=A0A4Y7XF70_9GAMM|nr:folate-binding Fe/S cluster repair protein [Alkanindiges illinoisensis]TEU30275.1 folate-binding Fe/S cluster repair protein [Alkanindiges illinoisensis]
MSLARLSFTAFVLNGPDAEKFLQGQVTVNVSSLTADEYRPTAICDLKGRVNFGLWLKKYSTESIEVVVADDQRDALQAHIKKYGAFSKFQLDTAQPVYPAIVSGKASFSHNDVGVSIEQWQHTAISQGQAWITAQTAGLFQPQELRLHQRGGVDYDKGCYLGQEIIARLWFRAKPKHWLHLIRAGISDVPAAGQQLADDIQVVNAIASADGWQALVVAKPSALEDSIYQVLDLPEGLNGDVGREK